MGTYFHISGDSNQRRHLSRGYKGDSIQITGDRAGRWERLHLPLREEGGGATSKVWSRDPRRGGPGSAPKGQGEWGCQLLIQQDFRSLLCKALSSIWRRRQTVSEEQTSVTNTPAAKGFPGGKVPMEPGGKAEGGPLGRSVMKARNGWSRRCQVGGEAQN